MAKLETKQGGGFTEEDGTEVAPRLLYRVRCACGYGAVWYTTPEKAEAQFDRNHGGSCSLALSPVGDER